MTMRATIIALSLATALAPVPLHAQESEAGEVAKKLSDPQAQLAAAAALAAISEAILDIDIAPFARAVAAAGGGGAVRDLPPDARLRDLAGPDAGRLPAEVARRVPRAMGAASEMAGAIDGMLPQLRETARRLKQAIPRY